MYTPNVYPNDIHVDMYMFVCKDGAMNKPQSVINWLNEYEELKQKLNNHRLKRTMMILAAHDRGTPTTAIAKLFDMQQQNVSHIIRHRDKYSQGLSAPKDEDNK